MHVTECVERRNGEVVGMDWNSSYRAKAFRESKKRQMMVSRGYMTREKAAPAQIIAQVEEGAVYEDCNVIVHHEDDFVEIWEEDCYLLFKELIEESLIVP